MPGATILLSPDRSTVMPVAASISAAVIPPGRNRRKRPPSTRTMVDSTPTGVCPPSTISGTRSPKPAATACAVVALTLPDGLALGAAIGRPKRAMMSAAMPRGMRSAIVSRPAVTSGLIAASDLRGSTSVSGPGQKARASAWESSSNTAMRSAIAMSQTWTISGLKRGLFLASNMRATASPRVASAARP